MIEYALKERSVAIAARMVGELTEPTAGINLTAYIAENYPGLLDAIGDTQV